jgi:hypothetical protein
MFRAVVLLVAFESVASYDCYNCEGKYECRLDEETMPIARCGLDNACAISFDDNGTVAMRVSWFYMFTSSLQNCGYFDLATCVYNVGGISLSS